MPILLAFAFLSGLLTIFAPCIWPLLPIVLSSSTSGGHRKPIGVTLGIITSFTVFTLSISYLVMLFRFDPDILRTVAAITIVFLGFTMITPSLLIRYELLVAKLTRFFGGQSMVKHHGFAGGYITGLSLGIVWSPCAGPILATIATLAATQAVNFQVVLITVAFATGVGVPLFLFSLIGAWLFQKSRFLSPHTGRIQKAFGVLMILTALAIYTNYDKVIQAKLLDLFPSYTQFLVGIETNPSVQKQLSALKQSKNEPIAQTVMQGESLPIIQKAPEFTGIVKWLNLPAGRQVLTLAELRGKVVLVDFWTYTCINCIRTLPYVTAWYEKYKDKGFVVVGVHTPEFEFEKKTENVLQAIRQHTIRYPVAQDNNYATWKAFDNHYWPAKYLIDRDGNIRYVHFGEQEYDTTERNIQILLKEQGVLVEKDMVTMPDETPKQRVSPETYLGSKRMDFLYPNSRVSNGRYTFKRQEDILPNTFSFDGEWIIEDEYAQSGKKAVIIYQFSAKKVFLVLKPPISGGRMQVFVDGKVIPEDIAGKDVRNGIVVINEDRLYNVVDLQQNVESHVLWIEFQTPGIQAFAFTFG